MPEKVRGEQRDEPPRPEGEFEGEAQVGEGAGPLGMGSQFGAGQDLDGSQGESLERGKEQRASSLEQQPDLQPASRQLPLHQAE
jgi:hypothetical protein